MGADAVIYGVIEGCGSGYSMRPGDHGRFHRHNRKVLAQLPLTDPYPPLVRGMFGVTFAPMVAYKVHAIHFGWATRNFSEDWPEWEAKFHSLLRRLVWITATVHVDAEDGELTAAYTILPHVIEGWRENPIRLNNEWHTEYTGWIDGWEPPLG